MAKTEDKKRFSHKQLAKILVKHADIHQGHWAISIDFGLGAANIPIAEANDSFSLQPTALVPIRSIGIVRHDEPNPLTVNAAKVNPKTEGVNQSEG
ncbi:MAG: hypothetical protein R6U98_10100 [Pirellulaceae bacterium]